MTAAAKPDIPRELEPEAQWRQRCRALLNGTPHAKLPMAMFEARVSYARAVSDRQAAEDEVRDAEHAWRELRVTDEATMRARGAVKQTLDVARARLRGAMLVEHYALGTLEAVRAAIELASGVRR